MPEPLAAGRHTIPLPHDGTERPYLIQIPERSPDRVPLVLQLHGRGIEAQRFDQLTGFGALADQAGFALAMPNAIGEIWNDGRDAAPEGMRPNDVGYLTAVIEDALVRAAIDANRIYVVGMSNGAAMTARLACESTARIAAIAQVAGTAGVSVAAAWRPARAIPILNIHGSADNIAPYPGGVRRGLMGRVIIRRAAAASIGVDAWARFWATANGAAEGPAETTLPPDTTIRTWRGPTPASDVVFYRIEGGGHTWPGGRITLPAFIFGRASRTFDAASVIWEFFSAHVG